MPAQVLSVNTFALHCFGSVTSSKSFYTDFNQNLISCGRSDNSNDYYNYDVRVANRCVDSDTQVDIV
jgi:hypothetical protein